MVANTCNSNTWEVKAKEPQQVQGQPELHGELQESPKYLLYSNILSQKEKMTK